MEKFSLLVVDDFYNDPDSVRNLALSLPFERRKDARYPGKEAISPDIEWHTTIHRIQKLIPEPSQYENIKNFQYPQGKFHLATEIDQNTRNVSVHTDLPKWSAVVYLSLDYHPKGGTQWYQHKHTGALHDSDIFLHYCFANLKSNSPEAMRKAIFNNSNDMEQWSEIQSIAMCYNRLVLFRADYFHANNFLFGDNPKNGRLTQHFVFWSEDQLLLNKLKECN